MEIKKVFWGFLVAKLQKLKKNHQISVLGCSLAVDYVEGCLIPFTFFHFFSQICFNHPTNDLYFSYIIKLEKKALVVIYWFPL
jgi:hypothetical protein